MTLWCVAPTEINNDGVERQQLEGIEEPTALEILEIDLASKQKNNKHKETTHDEMKRTNKDNTHRLLTGA